MISMLIIIICGDGLAQRFVVELGGGLVHDTIIQTFKHDVSCIVRSEARRVHEDQSVHEARSADCTDESEWSLSASDLTMHDTSCLNPIMT